MSTTVIRHAAMLVTLDAQRREIPDGALVIEDNAIRWVGATTDLPAEVVDQAARIMDARGKIVLPGFVNTTTTFTKP